MNIDKQSFLKIKDGVYKVAPGKYYFGDPCYVIGTEDRMCSEWSDLLDTNDCFNNPVGMTRGHQVLAFGTAHGDGNYHVRLRHDDELLFDPKTIGFDTVNSYGDTGEENLMLGVDAGLLGLVPVELIRAEKVSGYDEGCGIWLDIKQDSIFEFLKPGSYFLNGQELVNTDFQDENDYEQYEDEDYEPF